jgi:glucose-6-phosphate isomerase
MGLLSVWNRNVLGHATHGVIPYDQRLGRFPAYLQQLQMESNGKHVQLDGSPTNTATGPVVWGEPGTNGQHAFFQLIHQGTEIIPLDLLIAATPTEADAHHHDLLVANCFAQGQALMRGRTPEEADALTRKQGASEADAARLAPHKSFSGSRPTSTFLYRHLDPSMLGRLIALYEHKVFTEGAVWDINSFDQWGVELGKVLAQKIIAEIEAPSDAGLQHDPSTNNLVRRYRKQK